jgi:glycosyltransferase involved in cell wall biosynthesis
MKVCEIMAGDEEGGLENHFIDLANSLASNNEVHVIAHARYAERFSNEVNFHPLDLSRSRKNPVTLYRLLTVIKAIKPDVIHAHANKAAAMIAVLRRWIPSPCVATIHSLKRNTKMFECFDHLIAVSKGVARDIENEALTVIYNGRKRTLQPSRKSNDVTAVRIIITFVGRLVHVKGVDVLLKAFSKVENKNTVLRIVGEGEARHSLESLAIELGVEGRVSFLGSRNDIESIMEETDLVVISSRREGFPLVLVEALLCHRPVVSTRVPGACEILPEEVLAEVENPESLAERLNWALADPGRLGVTFDPVFRFAEATLTHNRQVYETEAILNSVAQRGKACAS